MTPDIDPTHLRRVPGILTAELLQMERDLHRMKGKDNRAELLDLIAAKRAALEFHQWAVKEMLR